MSYNEFHDTQRLSNRDVISAWSVATAVLFGLLLAV
jgi:hypothetical protein